MRPKSPVKRNFNKYNTTRLTTLRKVCIRESLSAVLITDTVDVAYISGFVSSNSASLIRPTGKGKIFTDFRYKTEAMDFCRKHPEWIFEQIQLCFTEVAGKYLKRGERVGYQADRMSVDEFNKLKKSAPGVRFVNCSRAINESLLIRLCNEISLIEKAARCGDAAFDRLLSDIRPGISERELANRLENYCRDFGSEKPSFDTIVLFGSRTALPHGKPGRRKLKAGDFVLIDFGCTIGGFCSDMTRTLVIGKADSGQRRLYSIVKEAQLRVLERARPGMEARQIDALARNYITNAGYGEQFGHGLGHGVGRRIHEEPRLSSRISLKIPAGVVVTIEPGIYIPGFGGIRIEDMVVINDDGVRLLTHSTRELLEV